MMKDLDTACWKPWIAASLVILCASATAAADWPPWLERLLFNPNERTERALVNLEHGDAGGAVEPLETALRLAPDHPPAQYNAGAARLDNGHGDAEPLLESAAAGAAGELVALARYNLGNARLAGDDLKGAIEAYEQALRREPAFEDAKYNLELARRRLQEQQDQQQDQDQDQDQQDQPQNPDRQQQDQQPPEPPPDQQDQEPQRQESSRPRFQDLPDMSAEEAAAILEAIENTEREQRRQAAIEAARKAHRGKKDW